MTLQHMQESSLIGIHPKYQDFLNRYLTNRPKHVRIGQHAFNVLHDIHPTLADKIRGGEFDPFYDDSRMGAFDTYVMVHWGME